MPIQVELIYPNAPVVIELLKENPTISPLLENKKVDTLNGDTYRIDITELVIEKNIYGNSYSMDSKAIEFLKNYQHYPAFLPEQFSYPKAKYILGEINKSFICWIKYIAEKSNSNLTICYEHERGDHLYELAKWIFDYSNHNAKKLIESLIIMAYMDNWQASLIKNMDGKIEEVLDAF